MGGGYCDAGGGQARCEAWEGVAEELGGVDLYI
jgi:hypothetical protein